MDKILDNLNENQKKAVLSVTGANLVIAGAGSGKTAVLTKRVAYLIREGVIPGRILCLTFTNKAAAEMNARVKKQLAEVGIDLPQIAPWKADYIQNPLLCTFHSLGVRILREYGGLLDLKKEFTILDTDDQKKIIRNILKELNVDPKNLQPSLALYFIGQCKQNGLLPDSSRRLKLDYLPIFHQIYAKYQAHLKLNHTVDFDDLILYTYILLRDYLDVRTQLQNRWWHIMVDEFQDTNQPQFEIIKLLSPPEMF